MDKYDSILLSLLIGDAFVKRDGSINFHHSIDQKQWAFHKAGILTSFGFTVKIKETGNKSFDKFRGFINVTTLVSDFGKDVRKLFYPNEEKIIPSGLIDSFGYEEWAIIYQDDGRQNKLSHYNTIINGKKIRKECEPFTNRYCICSQGFDYNSNIELQKSLLNLNVESSLYKVKGGYGKQLVIGKAKSKALFYNGIKNHMIDSMRYKLSVKPHMSFS